MAHAVGLDALASTEALLGDLAGAGFGTTAVPDLAGRLAAETLAWTLAEYHSALSRLPKVLQDDLRAAWGEAEADSACRDGAFRFAAIRAGSVLVALQPERGRSETRTEDYHSLSAPPRHGYVAFYLWLAAQGVDALIHMGAHGTLEWLPGHRPLDHILHQLLEAT